MSPAVSPAVSPGVSPAALAGGRIAVVVITRNRVAELARTLDQLSSLPERPAVIVVDNGSRDGTAPFLRREFPAVGVVALPGNGGAASRNVGVRVSGCDFVAFADDDSWWLPGSLGKAADMMDADPSIGLLAARILVGPEARPDPVSDAMSAGVLDADLQPRPGGRRSATGFLACGAVVRSRAFLAVGGFPTGAGVGGEEQTVAWDLWSAGWRVLYAPELTAAHFPAVSRRDPAVRRSVAACNDLWAAWSRLPAGPAAALTGRILGGAGRDPATALGVARALRGAGRALSRRAALPAHVERGRRVLSVR